MDFMDLPCLMVRNYIPVASIHGLGRGNGASAYYFVCHTSAYYFVCHTVFIPIGSKQISCHC